MGCHASNDGEKESHLQRSLTMEAATCEKIEVKLEVNPNQTEMYGKVREKFQPISGLERNIKFLWRTNDHLGAPIQPVATPSPEAKGKKSKKAKAVSPTKSPTESLSEAFYFRVEYLNPDTNYIDKSFFVMATKKEVIDLTKV